MANKHDKNIKITITDKGALKQTTKDINKLNKAQQKTNKSSQGLDRNMKGNARMSANASKNFSKQAQGMQGVLVPAYAEVAARVFALTAAYTAMQRASQFDILLKGQQQYAAQTGKNMAQIARGVQKASGFMLDFQEASSSTALASTAGLTAKQIERMTKGARAASVALGRNMGDAMDRLTRGIVKAEPEILDELGVIIRLDTVYKDFAKSINKTAAELTEMEKLTARNAAIMGQLDSKFGDIATSIPADAFSKLSATVTDLVLGLGGGAASALSPFISALADSKELLLGIMAIIGRGLLRTMFPVFNSMGDKLDTISSKLKVYTSRLKEAVEQGDKEALKANLTKLAEKDIARTTALMTKMGFDAGKEGGKKFVEEFRKGSRGMDLFNKKNMVKAIRQTIRLGIQSAQKPDSGGVATTPGMSGRTIAEMQRLDGTLAKLQGTLLSVSKAAKGNMAADILQNIGKMSKGFANLKIKIAGVSSSFLQVSKSSSGLTHDLGIVKALKASFSKDFRWKLLTSLKSELKTLPEHAKAGVTSTIEKLETLESQSKLALSGFAKGINGIGAVLGAAFTGISKGLNILVGIMGTFMMVKWIAQMAFSMSDAFSKASDALGTLNTNLDTTMNTLSGWSKKGGRAGNLGKSISDSVQSSEFKDNIAEGIATALESAGESLNGKTLADSTLGKAMDGLASLLGVAISDALEEGVSKALVGMSSSMSSVDFGNFLESSNLQANIESAISPSATAEVTGSIAGTTLAIASGTVAINTYTAAMAASTMGAAALIPVAGYVAAAVIGVGTAIYFGVEAYKTLGMSSSVISNQIVGDLQAVNDGILDPSMAVERITDLFEMSREEALQFYSDVTAAANTYAKLAKAQKVNLEELVGAFSKLSETRKSFAQSLVKGGDLKDFSTAFETTIKKVGDVSMSQVEKFRALNKEGLFKGAAKAELAEQIAADKALADIQKDATLRGEEKREAVESAQLKLNKANLALVAEQGAVYNKYYNSIYKSIAEEKGLKIRAMTEVEKIATRLATATKIAEEVAGGNATELYEQELSRALRLEELAQDKVHLAQFGNSVIKEQAQTEQKILKIAKEALVAKKAYTGLTEAEEQNVNDQLDIIDRKINNAGKTALKLNTHFHEIAGTVQTVSDKIKAMRKDQGGMTDFTFANWRMDLINTEINAFNNSLDDTFDSAQKVAAVLSAINEGTGVIKENLRQKFKNAFPDEKSFKNIAKWVKMAVTDQGKAITARMEVLNAEEASRELTLENWGKHEDLLAYRERIAVLERDYAEQGLKDEYEKLKLKETQAAISVVEANLVVAEWSALTSGFAEAMKGVGDGFAEGVSAFVSSKLLGRDESGDDRWDVALRKTLSTGLATGVGDIAGKFAQQQVFGNKGFLAQGVGMFSKDLADAMFPKTNTEKLREALKELKEEAVKRAAILEQISVNTGSTAANTSTTGTGTVGTGTLSNSIANLSVLQDKYRELSKAGYQVKQTPEAIDAAYKLLHPSKFEDSQVGGFSVTKGDRTVEVPPALADFFDRMKIVVKGGESDAFEGHKKAGYSLEGFDNKEAGTAAFYNAIASNFTIPKDSILFKNPEYFLQAAGKFAVLQSGTTKNGTGLNGMTDGETQAVFLDKLGGIDSVIHEAVHPLFDTFSTLAKDSENFDKYSSKSAITLWEATKAYVKTTEFASKTPADKERVRQVLSVGDYPEEKRIEEYVVRAIAQNSRLPEGSVPSEWLPEFMQQAMPEVIAEMDRLSTPSALTAFDASIDKSSNSLSKMDNNIYSVIKVVAAGSKFLKREYAKIEASIVKLFPKNSNGKYVQKGQEGYDLPYKDFAKQQGQKESAFRKGSQYRARETLKDAGKHEKGMYENSIQSDFLTHGRASSMQPSLFPQADLPFGKPIPPVEPSIFSKLAPLFEKLNTALLMLMPNENIMDTKTEMESLSDLPKGMSGALKVQEVDPKVPGGNGVPIPTTSITGDATVNKLSADLRGSMASNLQSQIMNDNLNAKALITNSLSTVGSNLMGSAINSMFGFANGGVATGGFRAFANGGTVTKPTLGLVGEGRYNEAVVPLPDGKSIPVIGAGGNSGDNNITVNVTVDSNGNAKSDTQSGMDGDQAKQLGYMISQAVQAELVEQQRHGGLLSSY